MHLSVKHADLKGFEKLESFPFFSLIATVLPPESVQMRDDLYMLTGVAKATDPGGNISM